MNYFIRCLIIYIIILLLSNILLQLCKKIKIEEFDTNIKIIYGKKEDCSNIFKNSEYIKNLNSKDLEARNCISIDNCIATYSKSIVNFTSNEKKYLEKVTLIINDNTKNFIEFSSIPWKFIKLKGNIENRFPFTLENTIFLNEIFFTNSLSFHNKVQTIFHEKLHIYQRYNQEKTTIFYKNLGFTLIECSCFNKINERSNPDVYANTHYIYKGYMIHNKYKINSKNLADIDIIFNKISNLDNYDGEKILNKLKLYYSVNIEHPNEIFATLIPLIVLKKIKFEDYFNDLNNEIDKYLN